MRDAGEPNLRYRLNGEWHGRADKEDAASPAYQQWEKGVSAGRVRAAENGGRAQSGTASWQAGDAQGGAASRQAAEASGGASAQGQSKSSGGAPYRTAMPGQWSGQRQQQGKGSGKSGSCGCLTILIAIGLLVFLPGILRTVGNVLQSAIVGTPETAVSESADSLPVEVIDVFPEEDTSLEESGDAEEYDPYAYVTQEMPASGERWEGTLTAGAYRVGEELPEGTYTISLDGNKEAGFSLWDGKNYISLSEYFSREQDDYTVQELREVLLFDGAEVSVSEGGTLRFSTENGQTAAQRKASPNPLTQSFTYRFTEKETKTLTGGRDLPAGVYDVVLQEGCGYLSKEPEDIERAYDYVYVYMDKSDYATQYYRGLRIEEGDTVTIEAMEDFEGEKLVVELTPSEKVYE